MPSHLCCRAVVAAHTKLDLIAITVINDTKVYIVYEAAITAAHLVAVRSWRNPA